MTKEVKLKLLGRAVTFLEQIPQLPYGDVQVGNNLLYNAVRLIGAVVEELVKEMPTEKETPDR